MRKSLVLSAAATCFVAVAENAYKLESRQFPGLAAGFLGPVSAAIGIGGKMPGGKLASTVEMTATGSAALGSRRVKIRYGPYNVPGKNRGAIGKVMDGQGGMAWNLPDRNVRKPCTDCMVTYIVAGLEDMKGKSMSTTEGIWLHHLVILNQGRGLKDATCASNPLSLPHIDVGTSPLVSERFFSTGNERTPVDLTNGTNAGYYIGRNDKFHTIVELMNMNKASQTVYMTVTWEYIPTVPKNYWNIRPVYLDAFECGLSDLPAKNQDGAFDLKARTWNANFAGHVLGVQGHLHDGGTNIDIIRNGQTVCRGETEYHDRSPDMKGMGPKRTFGLFRSNATATRQDATMHISNVSWCAGSYSDTSALGPLNIGDKWDLVGYYNYQVHPGMLRSNGRQSDVMALALLYVAVPLDPHRL